MVFMNSRLTLLAFSTVAMSCGGKAGPRPRQTDGPLPTRAPSVPAPAPCEDASKVPVDLETLVGLRLSDDDLKKIQFFASKHMLLERQIASGEVAVQEHKVIVKNGVRFEQVELDCLTPGRLIRAESERDGRPYGILIVSYEKGSSGLIYGPGGEDSRSHRHRFELADGASISEQDGVKYEGHRYHKVCPGAYESPEWYQCWSGHELLMEARR